MAIVAGDIAFLGVNAADPDEFAGRCEEDRHHFCFMISPEDAPSMADLRVFTRDLMGQAERNLGTKLDWGAADHARAAAPAPSPPAGDL